jgi:IS5 family transposase
MVDASIVPMPKQRNTREENEAVKRGETPAEWERKPAKNRQKDKDARWTKKHGRSFFGYKNHVNVDRTHKLIRRYAVTDAAVHDSRKLNGLSHQGNTSHDVFGDSAYRSAANEATLKGRGFRSRIHVRAARGHPLSKAQAAANRAKSRIRARIEHVFGAQEIAPGGRLLRTIGIVRARIKIGLQNFVYNVRRLATLERRRSHSFKLASRLAAA